ncbi:MAG TPA: hypothetical protein VE988_12025, partial [Gemmataceae bacterium]|nr:hypothetical protein [Gemmataceae bacterium]
MLTTYTWTGLGATTNWSNGANWSPNTGNPSSPGDIAIFSGSYAGPQTAVFDTPGAVVGEIDFATSSNITIANSNDAVLQMDNTGFAANSIISLTAGNTGTVTITAPVSGVNIPLAVTVAGGGLTVSGALTGVTPLTSGPGSIQGVSGSSITVNTGATFTLDDTSTTTLGSPNRLSDDMALTMNGGTFKYVGASNNSSTETIGAISINSGNSTITTTPTGTAGTLALTSSALTRSAGATVNFTGTGLGAANNQILFTAQPTLTGNILPY